MEFSRIIRITALLLIPAVTCSSFAVAEKKPMTPAAVKAKVEMRGVGRHVRFVLKNKSEVSGEIAVIGDESCVINSKQIAQPTTVAYADVMAIHNGNPQIGKKLGIGVGVGMAIGVAVLIVTAIVVIVSVAGSNTP